MNRDFFYIALLICVAPPLVVLSATLISMVSQ
jgi:hypothetical protein